jgi:hypothetical protein
MIALIQWLVMGHAHKWKTLEVVPLHRTQGNEYAPERICVGDVYIQQCEKCGHVRRVDLE